MPVPPPSISREREKNALAAPLQRQVEIFPHGQIAIDRWGLELPPDAEGDDFIFTFPLQICLLTEKDSTAGRFGLPANDIEQGRLPGSVRADNHAQFVAVDDEVQIVERFEAVVIDGDAFELIMERSFISTLPF